MRTKFQMGKLKVLQQHLNENVCGLVYTEKKVDDYVWLGGCILKIGESQKEIS
jgi:hypothetical protein